MAELLFTLIALIDVHEVHGSPEGVTSPQALSSGFAAGDARMAFLDGFRRIRDCRPAYVGEGRQRVRLASRPADDFLDAEIVDQQRVGDQGAMAAPRHCLSAHQHDTLAHGLYDELSQVLRKFGRLHVVCETAEGQVPPSRIQGPWTSAPETSQASNVLISDAIGTELGRQGIEVELRIVARAWPRTHVDEPGHRVRRRAY